MDENKFLRKAIELQKGSYDLHVHSLPSVFPRKLDGMELILAGEKRGMAGILLKSHYEPTALRAELINRYSHCHCKAYGGLVLNWPVGGLNPYAVYEALRAGAKIIWMPTRDAQNSLKFGNMSGDFFNRPGISVTNESGKLKDVVYEIMDLVKEKGGYLATGHLSPEESVLLCREGRKRNVPMILTHPEFQRTRISGDVQAEMAKLGVLIEKNWLNIATGSVTAAEMAANIRKAGVDSVYMSTDRGQETGPSPVEEFGNFIASMLEQGFTESEIITMTHTVPNRIIHGI
jgi:hypothetical protein